MRLGVKVVEEGECLKSWIRSGVVAGIRYNGLNSKVLRTGVVNDPTESVVGSIDY